ncbi:MAG: OsmC family protein [Acidobacteriia bacterium]|nr:OsmC family protein [Terriglobia bacterium]
MPDLHHRYQVRTTWTGNTGQGTAAYTSYQRSHEISAPHKNPILGTTVVPKFNDATRYNPEELLVAALSACHMMWLLHLCADAGITVVSYVDDATGKMKMGGQTERFSEVTLHPVMKITDPSRIQDAEALHEQAHKFCSLAASVNFPVHCQPSVTAD